VSDESDGFVCWDCRCSFPWSECYLFFDWWMCGPCFREACE
jgi:hypothetical protein